MSTHAVIRVDGSDVVLFKHWDGYPENTLPWLIKFNKGFVKKYPTSYPEYKVADLIRSTVKSAKTYNLCKDGWAVMVSPPEKGIDSIDAEYIYELKRNGEVSVVHLIYPTN